MLKASFYRLILHAVPDQSITVSDSIQVVVLTATSDSNDRRFELLPILGYSFIMRRRSDRNRLGSIAAMLSALSAFLVVHQTQAENAPRVSWISPTAFSLKPPKLAMEIDENRAGTINSVDGSGGEGCGMSPEEFAKFYPPLVAWIRNTLAASGPVAQTVASRGFSRLPLYFTEKTLASTKVVFVEPLPIPPLRSMGLARFADFERGNFDGITYLDTFFLKPAQANNETVYFHELVHVVQWRLLGPDRFLFLYANGLECFGYRQSPLEAMAYDAETSVRELHAHF